MKKIGILFGQERSFPAAFVERARAIAPADVQVEPVLMGHVEQGALPGYDVIIDRISQDVPFYRAALKHAAVQGTAVINNPFWWSAEDKLTANAMAIQVGVPVPKTALLPSKRHPDDTTAASFTNLVYPLGWQEVFDHVGFPAYMKPNTGGGWKSVYKVNTPEELFAAYAQTDQLNMLVQEAIQFERYYRCYCIGRKYVRVMPYEPRNAFHERYVRDGRAIDPDELKLLEEYVLKLCKVLGYDFNTVELAVRDGVPYAIDFTNPAPDADVHSVGQANFEWVVEHAARYAVERALEHKAGADNLTWGDFVCRSVDAWKGTSSQVKAVAKAAPAAKSPGKSKAAASKPATSAKPAAAAKRADAKATASTATLKQASKAAPAPAKTAKAQKLEPAKGKGKAAKA